MQGRIASVTTAGSRRPRARARAALVTALAALASVTPWSSRGDDPVLQHYLGALHEHSGYSDGSPATTPATYFASAKAFGLDFLGSGEHSDNADVPVTFNEACLSDQIPSCAGPLPDGVRKWDATLEQARAATDGSFTGFRGFEWTSDRFGHINVYFSRNDTNAKADAGYGVMDTFWQWFTARPELGGGGDGLATFNHPDDKKLTNDDPTKNWNNFAYVPAADARMVGIEMFNGRKPYDQWYASALDAGWHVGAVGAEDAHETSEEWGAPDMAKTVLIARDRSEGALREAMLARRMYAVQGDHNGLRMAMDVAGQPMGARIARTAGEVLPVAVSVTGAPGVARLELVTNGGVVAAAADATTLAGSIVVTDGESWYFVRVLDAAGRPIAYSSPVWVRAELDFVPAGEWVAGDLHIHTTYSHDSWGPHTGDDNTGPDEFWTLGHTVLDDYAIASSRGLDYLAITDHNDIRSQDDAGFGAFGVIPVAAYEASLGGHAQMLGARACYYPEGPQPATQRTDCNGFPNKTTDRINAVADALRADGGAFQINHPADGPASHPVADWSEHGYGVVPDTIEVWNIAPLWQQPMPSGGSTDDALGYWEDFLDMGLHVGATGGSDNHWVSTTAVQGPGQPTTWVWVTERSERGILEGLRAGRTTISWQPPASGGPRLFLEADADGDGVYESMVGDTVPAGAEVRVRAEGAPPGSRIEVRTGCAGGDEECTSAVFDVCDIAIPYVGCPSHGVAPDEVLVALDDDAIWVRAELVLPDLADERAAACDERLGDATTYCRNRILILSLTSALYVG